MKQKDFFGKRVRLKSKIERQAPPGSLFIAGNTNPKTGKITLLFILPKEHIGNFAIVSPDQIEVIDNVNKQLDWKTSSNKS
ncbi:MAG: hypothetical protein WCZ11_00290 [Bacilli bacterium]